MTKVFIKTMGCKVNSFDSQAIEHQLRQRGCEITDQVDGADITIVNTCSVTAQAEKEARYLLRRYKRINPESIRVVTGCYAQIDSATLQNHDEVDFVIPNEAKTELADLICSDARKDKFTNKLPNALKPVANNRQNHFKASLTLFDKPRSNRTRTYIKIQDGCNGFCAYCQIPYARGASRSVPMNDILAQILSIAKEGVSEIVFTGIHLGDYGHDLGLGDDGFCRLLEEVVKIPGINRFRISSLEPAELSQSLVDFLADHKSIFCPHFHLPLQSGSDRILKMMRRQYDSRGYKNAVDMIRERFPDAHISADIIPGFPQETEEDHEQTMRFIETCGLASLHVFPYSKRPNTLAIRLPGHLPAEVIKRRASELRALAQKLSEQFLREQMGSQQLVLWESDYDESGRRVGKTRNYIRVAASSHISAQAGLESLVTLKGYCATNTVLGV